jgi:hypothetical protein
MHYVALEGTRTGWLDYEAELARVDASALVRPAIDENDLLTDRRRRRTRSATAGSTPATRWWFIPTGSWRSAIASRT